MRLSDRPKAQRQLEDCFEVLSVQNHPFSPWEVEFLTDLQERYDEYGSDMYLSDKQAVYINRAWEKI